MKSNTVNRVNTKDKSWRTHSISLPLPIITIAIVLLVGGGLGILFSSIISKVLATTQINRMANQIGNTLVLFGPVFWSLIIGIIIMTIIIVLRQYVLAATIIIVVHLYLDFYLGLAFVALVMLLTLLPILYLLRSTRNPWVEPRVLWLWMLFLVLALFPAMRGITFLDSANYYLNLIFNALMVFWLGQIVGRNIRNIRQLFIMLSVFGTLIAIITIIQQLTGNLLFETAQNRAFIQSLSDYDLPGGISRAGAFLVNPNPNGCFCAMMLLIILGLFVESTSLLVKIFYLAETLIIAFALLLTYSTGAWLGAMAGVIVLVALVGRMRYRFQIFLLIFAAFVVLNVGFSSQVDLLLNHASKPSELSLRIGAWETGIQVIRAFPLTGIGLGSYVYRAIEDAYRVPAEYIRLNHPHNSYLELAALGGIPILIIFLSLIANALWQALHNWAQVDENARPLFATGVAVIMVLSVYSLSATGWTNGPLSAIGWLILGTISSPLIANNLKVVMKKVKHVESVDSKKIETIAGGIES